MVAGYPVLKDQYVQWGQQVEQVAPKEAPNTQGLEPLGAWAIPTPPRPRLQLRDEDNSSSRARSRGKKNQEKDAQPEKIKRKIVISDLRNPPKNCTPLFGEVAKFRTLTKKEEQ